MASVKQLHQNAMELAQKSLIARERGEYDEALDLAKKAMVLETEAADLVSLDKATEPTRSVLYRSAASLAYQCKDYKEAQRLIAKGLAGYPPPEIEEELKNLYEDVNFEYHLQIKGEILAPEDFQMSMTGDVVGSGIIFYNEFMRRIETTKTLLDRTIERLMNREYRSGGRISREYQPFVPALSIPRPGSFAISFKLVSPQDQQLALFVQPERVIEELITGIDLMNSGNDKALKSLIGDDKYLTHFVSNVRQMAPDGQKINFVGFTSSKVSAGLTKPRKELQELVVSTVEKMTPRERTKIEVEGLLDYAVARDKNIVGLTANDNKRYTIHVDEGFEDVVRSYFGAEVLITGFYDEDIVYLTDIQSVNQ